VEWLSSNEEVAEVKRGEVLAKKSGYTTVYAHVVIGEGSGTVSRYIIVPKGRQVDGWSDGLLAVEPEEESGEYYTLTGVYVGKDKPAQAGIYLLKRGDKWIKLLVR
jgi:hypothetical protein